MSNKVADKDLKIKRSLHQKKYVKAEELDDEIKFVERRLAYLRNRKKTGIPGGNAKAKGKKGKPLDSAQYQFFHYWTREKDYVAHYRELRDNMVKSGKSFVAFQTRIFEVVNKFGTAEEKEKLKNLANEIVK